MSGRLKRFALLCLIGTVLVLFTLIYAFRFGSFHYLSDNQVSHGRDLGQVMVNALEHHGLYRLLQGDTTVADLQQPFREAVLEQMEGLPIIKLKLYDLNGSTLFSTNRSEIGQTIDNYDGLIQAIAGKVVGELVHKERIEVYGDVLAARDIFEIYVPVPNRTNEVVGVIELYSDVTDELAILQRNALYVSIFITSLMGGFYLLLFIIFYYTDRSLRREEREREQLLNTLQRGRQTLEERVRARTEDLEYARYYLQSIIDGITDPVMVIGMDLHVLSKNQAAVDVIPEGADPADYLYCYQITHHLSAPCHADNHPCAFSEVIESGKPCKVMHQHVLADGSIRHVEISSTPLRDIKGNMLGIIEVEHDITEVIMARDRLQENEERARAIMNTVTDAILAVDREGKVRDLNDSAEQLFACNRKAMIGRDCASLINTTLSGVNFVNDELEGLVSKGVQERYAIDSNQTRIPVDLWVGRTRLSSGQMYIAVFHDIRSRQAARKELEQTRVQYFHQEKMAAIGQLAAGILHEVGNPIAAISGSLQAIQATVSEQQERQDSCLSSSELINHLEMIEVQLQRLSGITREIADFASPRKGEQELVNLNGLIRSTTNLMRYDKRFKGTAMVLELDGSIPAIIAIADQLTQVMMNLLINAADACEAQTVRAPKIVVRTRLEGEQVHIEVKDNGIGMDSDTAKMATEAFFTTKPAGKGTGLGLSLCWTIISRHAGHAAIESNPGAGTTIHLFLPVALSDKE